MENPADLRRAAAEVARRVERALGDRLVGVWLVGSAALGDFDPRRSDLDIQAVARERPATAELAALAADLEGVPVPGRGLEFVLYASADLADRAGPRFSLNLNCGPGLPYRRSLDPDADPRFWFTLDVSIARQSGLALIGPPTAEVFPDLPRSMVAMAAEHGLRWHSTGPSDQAVLSACRSWAWATDGRWRSKGESGHWAVARLSEPGPVLRALAARSTGEGPLPGPDDVAALKAHAHAALADLL